jgi:5-formyltetrahydrofolate cyclo-ligase
MSGCRRGICRFGVKGDNNKVTTGAGSSKASLRKELLARRSDRSAAEISAARAAITAHVLTLAGLRGWQSVAAYRAMRTEPGSPELLAGLAAAGIRVITPVVLEDNDLSWTTEPDRADDLGVEAVLGVHALLIPALAVDRTGRRLGRGGGSYDRVIARLGAAAIATFVLVFDDEILELVPTDPWDQSVTGAISPAGLTSLLPLGLDVE